MAQNRLVFEGLAELKAALRSLPADLAGEAGHEVMGAANGAAAEIKRNYRGTEASLAAAVQVEHADPGRFAAGARIITRHKLAWIFEVGTQMRHTAFGANRGAIQPPRHAFIPPIIKARRLMYTRLADLLRRHGLTVTGTDG